MPALLEKDARDAAARGVGRFLSLHERCAQGFAITRNGAGRLQVVCGGCGGHCRYRAADAERLRGHSVDLGEITRSRHLRPSAESLERWLPAPPALPWWVPNAYIVAVILVGVGLIAFGVLRPRDPESAQPSETPVPAKGADLRRVVVLDRFAIGIPQGWGRGTAGGAIVFSAPSLNARLRIFLEPRAVPPRRVYRQALSFLAAEHPGAEVRRRALGGLGELPAVTMVSKHEQGRQWAALLAARGHTYFLIADVDGTASPGVRSAALAALRSFRPR